MNRKIYIQSSFLVNHPIVLKSEKNTVQFQSIVKILSVLVIILLLLPERAFAREFPQKRIMIQLKQEVKNNDCGPFCKDNRIGNNPIDALNKQIKVNKIKKITAGRATGKHIYLIEVDESENIQDIITQYKKTGQIIHAEPDQLGHGGGNQILVKDSETPGDEFFYRQWSLRNDGSFSLSPATEGSDIDMLAAWEIETGDPELIIAILDSGVNTNEMDIKDRLWRNPGELINGELTNNGADDEENGYIDDHTGWDFANDDNGIADGNGHGSNIAGIIAAQPNNDIGYTGINWNSKIMILKALDDQLNGWYSWWIDAIFYAVDNGANIINMSLGGIPDSEFLKQAVDYALENGVPVVACMMNDDNDIPYYPAAYPGVIAVGSTNPDDTRSTPFFWSDTSGSNYGQHISVIAPGNYIYSISNLVSNYNIYWGGTSMAAPHVTGVASLLLSQNPEFSPADIKQIIEITAEDQIGDPTEDTEGWDPYYGHGRLNAYKALSLPSTSVTEQHEIIPEVHIFPNPVHDFLQISASEPISHIQILDLTGKVIHQKQFTMNKGSINVTGFKAGVYLIRTYTKNLHLTKKWVKY